MASKTPRDKAKPAPKPVSKPAPKPKSAAAKPAGAQTTAAPRPATKAAAKPARTKVPFPKKNQAPSEAEFLARLPLAVGKKFEAVRAFLKKQPGVAEDLYYYGPSTGWAFRYLRATQSLATVMIHADRLVGTVALDAAAMAAVDFPAMSDVANRARKLAHGSPTLSWLDLPLDGPGAADFKILLKAKLKTLPPPGPPPPPPPPPARRSA